MWLFDWVRGAGVPRSGPSRARRPVSRSPRLGRLRLESLEDRLTPSGGLLDSSWSLPPSLGNFIATAVQPDSKVVAVGKVPLKKYGTSQIAVVRMNPNGSLDTSFNGTGSTTFSPPGDPYVSASAVTLQPDGKILVGGSGSSEQFGPSAYVVARLNANGTLDTTFGNTGRRGVGGGVWAYPPGGVIAGVSNLALLPDGSIIGGAVGTASDGYEAFAAFKLTPTGTLNSSFGTGGLTIIHVGTQANSIDNGLAVTTSGEVVLAGAATPAGASVSSGCLVALTPTGQLDTNFNGTGYLMQDFGGPGSQGTEFNDAVAQGNTIVVAGYLPGDVGQKQGLVARYTLSGALDTSFNAYDPVANPQGTPGYFLAAPDTRFTAVALEPDGSIALGGWGYYTAADGTHVRGLVAHLSADGVLDTSFGTDGTGFAYFYGVTISSHVTMSLGPDGSLVLFGWTGTGGGDPVHGVFARFTAP